MADDEKMPGQGPRHSPLRVWAVLVPALAAVVCVLVIQKRKDENATPGAGGGQEQPVEEKTSSPPGVFLINKDYDRIKSKVLIRRVVVPTLARLDFAAYDANIMLHDPEEYAPKPPAEKVPLAGLDFNGALDKESLCDRLEETPLTDEEKKSPMAWLAVSEYLLNWDFDLASNLAEAGAAVSAEKWNDEEIICPYQEGALAYLHKGVAGHEMWVKVEFKPWVKFLQEVDDEDGDGFPEIYGRFKPEVLNDKVVEQLTTHYVGEVLNKVAVESWAHELDSYWYPTYMTERLSAEEKKGWPDEKTRADAGKELAALPEEEPTMVIRGKPFEKYIYLVLYVEGMAGE